MAIRTRFIQPDNPTDEERHNMLKMTLEESNRVEDYKNIIELLSPCKDITTIASPGTFKGIKVGIIGGGIAGLTSAFELRKVGFDITIFETEEKRIGGRIYTHYFDEEKGLYGEFGAMRIPAVHETTWHYINTFGLKTKPFTQSNPNSLIYVRGKRARNDYQGKSVMENIYPEFNLNQRERRTPWQQLINYALSKNLLKIDPSIRKELIQIKEEYSLTIEYLGSLGIRKVLEKMGLSEGAIEMISCVAPFLGYFYNNSYLENLIEEYTVDYAYRYEIVGGTAKLPLAFYNSLMSKQPVEYINIKESDLGSAVSWKNGKTVIGIYKKNPDKVILEYKDEKTNEVLHETFDFVICAIPFSSLRNVEIFPMFSQGKMQAIKEVNYTSSQKTIFLCNERFWEDQQIFGGGSSTDLPIGTIWYPSSANSNKLNNRKFLYRKKNNLDNQQGVLLASYNLNQDAIRIGNLDEKICFEQIKRQVEAVHGLSRGYLDSVVEDFKIVDWNKEKGFYGAFCYFMPEQQSLFSYIMAQPEYENKIYFAGEHISLIHGWIEGAISSGMIAANNLAEYCKMM